MKLICHGGYNKSKRESYKEIIFSNTMRSVVESMSTALAFIYILLFSAILETMPQLDLALSPQNDARRATILALPPQIEADILPGDIADAIQSLWQDSSIQEAVHRSHKFQLNDSAIYYFNAMDRMASPSYLPTDQDILQSQLKTTGITETTFKVGELTYKLCDVDDQRSEQKKIIALRMC
jgi:guanine nucleotide-binding protein G(i) subunit alpha